MKLPTLALNVTWQGMAKPFVWLVALCWFSCAAPVAEQAPPARRMLPMLDMSGVWKDLKDGAFVTVTQTGDQLAFSYDGTERAKLTGTITAGRRVTMALEDGCCMGSFLDDSTIHWSNDTMWQRMQLMVNIAGEWRDEHGLVVTIAQEGDELSLTSAGRAPVSGRAAGGKKIQVAFDRDCCTGTLSDDKTIHWSNQTVWKK